MMFRFSEIKNLKIKVEITPTVKSSLKQFLSVI